MKKLCLLLAVCLLASCSYKSDEIPEVMQDDSKTRIKNDGQDVEININTDDISVNNEVGKKSLNELLDIFFNAFVIPVNKNGAAFDTLVKYEAAYKLMKADDKNFMNLTNGILKKIAEEDLTNKSREYKAAFYINTFNFLAIYIVYSNYYVNGKKIKSIRELKKGVVSVFKRKLWSVAGEKEVSFDDLEEDKIKPLMIRDDNTLDARFHFALNPALRGCQMVLNKAFNEKELEMQLTYVTEQGLALPRMILTKGDRTSFSKLLGSVYKDDMEDDQGSLEAFISRYNSKLILGTKQTTHDFDWNINDFGDGVSIPELPELGNKPETDITDVNAGGSSSRRDPLNRRDCKSYLRGEFESVIALCDVVTDGDAETAGGDYRYKSKKAHLCLISTEDVDGKPSMRVEGQILSADQSENNIEKIFNIEVEGRMKKFGKTLTMRYETKEPAYRVKAQYNTKKKELFYRETNGKLIDGGDYRRGYYGCK